MVEETNVEVVKEFCDAYQRSDLQRLLNTLSKDVEFIHPMTKSVWPWAGTLHGHDGIVTIGAGQLEVLEYEIFEPKEFIAQGDKVVLLVFERFRIIKTGLIVNNDFIMVFTISNGKISKIRVYEDTWPIIAAIRGQEP